ncbi:uncharacterized protein LOC127510164 [Ctenopharyngodon idella]|uniref:uncharacterized protein LOC127510164 n=1 Tax=Ctenopharyngodon idella TaxID=7959 RepID=UPI002232A6F9|nr:uncharacterized protein LOC127510164 [Ctenopharyngodon idella]
MSSDRTHGQRPSPSPSSAEAAKAASANAAAGEGMESLQSQLLGKTWKQSPLKLTVIMALTVAAAEIIIDMAGPAVFNRVVGPVAGAVTGAGLCILRSLREAGVREEAVTVGAAAVAGGIAGTVAAEILQLLSGAQSQRGSAVIGTMAGAAIIAVSGLHMQLLIDTVKWVLALVEREISAIQWGTKVTKLASLTATVIGVSKSAIAAVLKMSQTAALSIAAAAAAGAEASGVAAEGSTASGVAATVIRVSKSAVAILALIKREISAIQWSTKLTQLALLTATVIRVSKLAIAAILKGAGASGTVERLVAGLGINGAPVTGV